MIDLKALIDQQNKAEARWYGEELKFGFRQCHSSGRAEEVESPTSSAWTNYRPHPALTIIFFGPSTQSLSVESHGRAQAPSKSGTFYAHLPWQPVSFLRTWCRNNALLHGVSKPLRVVEKWYLRYIIWSIVAFPFLSHLLFQVQEQET